MRLLLGRQLTGKLHVDRRIQIAAILSFPDHEGVVYIEGLTGDLYAEGADVERCTTVFNDLRSSALSPSESIAMIKQIRAAQQA